VQEKRFVAWLSSGSRHAFFIVTLIPAFTFEELQDAAAKAQAGGAFSAQSGDLAALATPDAEKKELADLRASLFDPAFEPLTTAKTPPPGHDILRASSNNFYAGVTLADVKNFSERYPLNSRLVKDARGMREEVYRAGTADGQVPPGLYATYLRKAIGFLTQPSTSPSCRQGSRSADRDRRFPREHDRRQPAERAGDPR
jgi:dipeptidyl-peptidase III